MAKREHTQNQSASECASSARVRCKPGDRARVVDLAGKVIVIVVRRFEPGEEISGHSDWVVNTPAWVTVPVGAPLRCYAVRNHVYAFDYPPVMCMPIADARLQPLLDDEGGTEGVTVETNGKKATKSKQSSGENALARTPIAALPRVESEAHHVGLLSASAMREVSRG